MPHIPDECLQHRRPCSLRPLSHGHPTTAASTLHNSGIHTPHHSRIHTHHSGTTLKSHLEEQKSTQVCCNLSSDGLVPIIAQLEPEEASQDGNKHDLTNALDGQRSKAAGAYTPDGEVLHL